MFRNENQHERKERLDKEWLAQLPCATCHPKMQKMCKAYNTFVRPDHNPVFKVSIECSEYLPNGIMKIDPLAESVPIACDGSNIL